MRQLLHRAPGYVWVNKEEIAALAARLNMSVVDFEADYVRQVGVRKSLIEYDNGDCVFFDGESRGCRCMKIDPASAAPGRFGNRTCARPRPGKRRAKSAPAAAKGRWCRWKGSSSS